eukprot:1074363-Amphidinium_carterae.1
MQGVCFTILEEDDERLAPESEPTTEIVAATKTKESDVEGACDRSGVVDVKHFVALCLQRC